LRQTVAGAADARETLHIIVPGRDVGIADGPVHGNAFFGVGLEIEIAPAVALATPHQRTAADVKAAIPVKTFDFGIGAVFIVHPKIRIEFVVWVIAFLHGMRGTHFVGDASAVRKLPDFFVFGRIVRHVAHIAPAFQQDGFQALFGEFFGGPAPGNPGANDNGVVLLRHDYELTYWLVCLIPLIAGGFKRRFFADFKK
jgi:hypothetical protein